MKLSLIREVRQSGRPRLIFSSINMYRFSFVTCVAYIILATSLYTEAKGRGGGHHSYPPSHGISGTGSHSGHKSPGASHGVSRSSHSSSLRSTTHTHIYKPPPRISYIPHGGAPMTYPVYVGTPPAYVYEYRDSGSVYRNLLTGLALYNLGSLSSSHRHHNYNPQPGEQCKFGVKKSNGDYEETKIKCEIMTSFILEEENKVRNKTSVNNTTIVTTTWSNVTTFDMTNGQPNSSSTAVSVNVTYTLAPNGTLIPQVTSQNITNDNGTITSLRDSVNTTITTNTTAVTNALDVKGKEIQVTPEMQCYMIRNTPTSIMRKSVPCGVLQSYAAQSFRPNFAQRHVLSITLLAAVFVVVTLY